MKIVVTIIGQDKVGIIAMVSNVLAKYSVNIVNIDQSIVDNFFNMVMLADMSQATISLKELNQMLKDKGIEMGLDIKVQHEDIFNAMHKI